MKHQSKPFSCGTNGITAPLHHPTFRRMWFASLVTNFGILIQGVGAAWAMTQMRSSADQVALVQTALLLPVMLIAIPAGAIADMHDRRIAGLVALSIELCGATALAVLAWLDLTTPNLLLAPCFAVGSGMALMGPAWQSSVSEQVPAEALPAAVALNGISYNIARSVGLRSPAWSLLRPVRWLRLPSTRCSIFRSCSRFFCGNARQNPRVCPLKSFAAPLFRACATLSIRQRSRSCWCVPW